MEKIAKKLKKEVKKKLEMMRKVKNQCLPDL